jgi:hypothetical protein
MIFPFTIRVAYKDFFFFFFLKIKTFHLICCSWYKYDVVIDLHAILRTVNYLIDRFTFDTHMNDLDGRFNVLISLAADTLIRGSIGGSFS